MTTSRSLEDLVNLLFQALREPLRRKEIVGNFQAIAWEGLELCAAMSDWKRKFAPLYRNCAKRE